MPPERDDEGLFVAHFERGREQFDAGRIGEAEKDLVEACLIRPRDQRVLNLLGLVYFKQQKYAKAEEVYRRLAVESPDVPTLFYNLGLIYFKLGRLEEAETAFQKSLELGPENAKIEFYLGSIYEKLHRFQDAIYRYRHAGASLMVRRVEDKIAAGPGPAAPPARPAAPAVARPRAPLPPLPRSTADTAEFRVDSVKQALHEQDDAATLVPGKRVEKVSPALLARSAATDTNRFKVTESADADARRLEPATKHPVLGSFRPLERGLLEATFSGKLFIKQGTIYSYSGNLTFWVKEKRPGGRNPLVIISGSGRVLLTDGDREITFVHVTEDEQVFVEPGHLLACEETLTPRYVPLVPGVEYVVFEGRGSAALSIASKALSLSVTPDLPVSVPYSAIITWSGRLQATLIDDPHLREMILPPARRDEPLLRIEGAGRVLVEQTP
ncbi:MAG: tetratricopeptide repeat protein [Vicinamibacteria bacterium]|nr:tetratricopeptide repeat protein [Vicinamibacteria bacterium]